VDTVSFATVRIGFVVGLVAACGPGGHGAGDDQGSGIDAPGSASDGGTDISLVYAHSGTMLYRVDSTSFTTVAIGPFNIDGESLTDLAVDKNEHMVGITLDRLYSIDSTTGSATLFKSLSESASGFTSLSYIPTDLTDPNSADILVSANDQGAVYQIDATTGSAKEIGSYGMSGSNKIVSSGDLIGVRDLGIYATVDVGNQQNDDYLAKIDPATWQATLIGSGTGFSKIFGLGFWAGTIYGFVDGGDNAGKMITIDSTTGVGTLVNSGTVEWYGAGVTTDAPIIQ
jgi:hypothetical protein